MEGGEGIEQRQEASHRNHDHSSENGRNPDH